MNKGQLNKDQTRRRKPNTYWQYEQQQQTFNCLEKIQQKSCNFFGQISQAFETTKLEKKEKALYWL
jgi:hypothetical protein